VDLAVALGDAPDGSLVVRMTKGIQGGGRQRVQILHGGATWRTMAPFEVGFEDGIGWTGDDRKEEGGGYSVHGGCGLARLRLPY